MELAIYLARVWGLGLVLTCIGLLINKKAFFTTLKKFDSPSLLLFPGILILGIGVAQVVGFNEWYFNWRGLVTLLGWSALLKGAFILCVPSYTEKFMKLAVKENIYTLSLIVCLVLGAYLLYAGYTA